MEENKFQEYQKENQETKRIYESKVEEKLEQKEIVTDDNTLLISPKNKKSSITGIVVGSFATLTLIGPAIVSPTLKLNTYDIQVTDNAIHYYFEIDYENLNGLQLSLYQDTREIETEEIEERVLKGYFIDLEEDTEYNILIREKEAQEILFEQKIKTDSKSPVTQFYQVDYICRCREDGYFYFTIFLRDDFHYYSDYEIYLKDRKGEIFPITLAGEITDQQKIRVDQMHGGEYTFAGKAKSVDPSDLNNGNTEITLFNLKIKL